MLISTSGLVTIVGGKWTTYRKMAQDTVDRAIEVGGLPHRPCVTETLRLHGWKPPDPAAPADALALYGTDAEAIEALMREEPGLRAAAAPAPALPPGARRLGRAPRDGAHARGRAGAPHPQPAARRRASIDAAPAAAQLLARELGRDAAWASAQVETYRQLAAGYRLTSG